MEGISRASQRAEALEEDWSYYSRYTEKHVRKKQRNKRRNFWVGLESPKKRERWEAEECYLSSFIWFHFSSEWCVVCRNTSLQVYNFLFRNAILKMFKWCVFYFSHSIHHHFETWFLCHHDPKENAFRLDEDIKEKNLYFSWKPLFFWKAEERELRTMRQVDIDVLLPGPGKNPEGQ